jgi:hypothetical protein
MAGPYIYVGDKYVALDSIRHAARGEDGRMVLSSVDGVADRENSEFDTTLLTLIPPQGEWECITPLVEEDGDLSAVIEPVLAFGLSVFGNLAPVVPSAPGGVVGDYVLRRPGRTTVYGVGGPFDGGVDEWLDSLDAA